MLVSYICFFVCTSAQTSVSLPRLVCAKDPPPPVRVLRTPRPPLRAKSPRMPPFAAYRHSTPAVFTVTRVNKVDLPFFEEAGPFPSIVPSCLQHAHSVYN